MGEEDPASGYYRIDAIRGKGGRLDIVDYRCPACHKLVYWDLWAATYCPHCGAPIFGAPQKKLEGPTGRKPSYSTLDSLKYNGPQPRRHDPEKRKRYNR